MPDSGPQGLLDTVTPCEGVGVEIERIWHNTRALAVTPCEGVGVEILPVVTVYIIGSVTPCEGVGVEIF